MGLFSRYGGPLRRQPKPATKSAGQPDSKGGGEGAAAEDGLQFQTPLDDVEAPFVPQHEPRELPSDLAWASQTAGFDFCCSA